MVEKTVGLWTNISFYQQGLGGRRNHKEHHVGKAMSKLSLFYFSSLGAKLNPDVTALAERSYTWDDSWVEDFCLQLLEHKSYKQPWMSKPITELHVQAYEDLSQTFTPYTAYDIKTKWA